jgi:hypothetical protein
MMVHEGAVSHEDWQMILWEAGGRAEEDIVVG